MSKTKQFELFWQDMETFIQSVPSNSTIFNQYCNSNEDFDVDNANIIRKTNLKTYLKGVVGNAKVLIVGEAPSYCGTRFSGVPFAAEKQLIDHDFYIHGERSSNDDPVNHTKGRPPYCSSTDIIFWEVMRKYYPRFILWETFPFHPHKPGIPLSNRKPTKDEVCQCEKALILIKRYFNPSRIIAVGRTAEKQLKALGEHPLYVRHPAHGGKVKFATGMKEYFER